MSETKVTVDQALLKKLMMEQECTSGKFEGHRASSNEGRLAAAGFYVGFRCEKCKQMVWLDRDKVMDREPDPKATPPIGIDFGYDGPLAGFGGINSVVSGQVAHGAGTFPRKDKYTGFSIFLDNKSYQLGLAFGAGGSSSRIGARSSGVDNSGAMRRFVICQDYLWYQYD